MRLRPARRLPPVLVYHAVCRRPTIAVSDTVGLIVEPRDFEWQMADLAARRLRTLTLDAFGEVVSGGRGPERSVLLTFDDAYAHLDEVVTPVLQRYGFTAAVFAAPATLGKRNTWDRGTALEGMVVASPDRLATMAAGPWEVGSHAREHIDLRQVEPRLLRSQLAQARDELGQIVGSPVVELAYPYGHNDGAVRQAARQAGHRLAFTVKHGDRADPFRLPRLMVNGEDGALAFRLASGPGLHTWAELFRDHTPAPVRRSVRAIVQRLRRGRGRAYRPGVA